MSATSSTVKASSNGQVQAHEDRHETSSFETHGPRVGRLVLWSKNGERPPVSAACYFRRSEGSRGDKSTPIDFIVEVFHWGANFPDEIVLYARNIDPAKKLFGEKRVEAQTAKTVIKGLEVFVSERPQAEGWVASSSILATRKVPGGSALSEACMLANQLAEMLAQKAEASAQA